MPTAEQYRQFFQSQLDASQKALKHLTGIDTFSLWDVGFSLERERQQGEDQYFLRPYGGITYCAKCGKAGHTNRDCNRPRPEDGGQASQAVQTFRRRVTTLRATTIIELQRKILDLKPPDELLHPPRVNIPLPEGPRMLPGRSAQRPPEQVLIWAKIQHYAKSALNDPSQHGEAQSAITELRRQLKRISDHEASVLAGRKGGSRKAGKRKPIVELIRRIVREDEWDFDRFIHAVRKQEGKLQDLVDSAREGNPLPLENLKWDSINRRLTYYEVRPGKPPRETRISEKRLRNLFSEFLR